MKPRLVIALVLVLGSGLLILTSAFPQGGLTPPGAPGPTMKTLDQIQPRTPIPGGTTAFNISSEGSYYLSGNLSVASANAILVNASNVTIDLQGFEIVGTGGSTGIFINGGISNVTIRNGTIRNFTSDGINGQGNSKVRVENLRALNNGSIGINVDVNGAVVDCVAEANAGAGILGLDNCVIHNCQSIGNTGANSHGISVGNAAQISGCVVRSNGGAGLVAGSNGIVRDCVAAGNTGDGIQVNGAATRVEDNNCASNGGAGVKVSTPGELIIKNNATSNGGGDYNIAAGSNYGQIVVTPGANFTTATAWANFSSSCPSGQSFCAGVCTNLSNNPNNCGSCGTACTVANGSAGCTSGNCVIASCNSGFANCDNQYADGCEVNTNADPNNCGNCGVVCTNGANVSASGCAMGGCSITACNAGFGNCDGQYATGCETNINANANNCGACGNVCSAPNVGSYLCNSGQCGIGSCNSGFANCDNQFADGCETNLNTDTANCGSCGHFCVVANGTAGCAGAACIVAACNSGFANCNNVAADGCEVNLKTDPNHCGTCATVCPSGHACSNGVCQ